MKTTTFIDLLRHGETQGGAGFFGSTDVPLTEKGSLQMWAAVEKLACRWDYIVTSPLGRCAKFAHALQQRHAIPVSQDTRLTEIHFGDWEGSYPAKLAQTEGNALIRFWNNPLKFPPPDAECLASFEQRVLSAWHDVTTQYGGQNILLVTHSGVMRIILCHILRYPVERLLEFKISHAAIRRISVTYIRNHHKYKLLTGATE